MTGTNFLFLLYFINYCITYLIFFTNISSGTKDMAQQLKELDALPETLSLVPALKSVVNRSFTPVPGELDIIF